MQSPPFLIHSLSRLSQQRKRKKIRAIFHLLWYNYVLKFTAIDL